MKERLEMLHLELEGSFEEMRENIESFCKDQAWEMSEIRHACKELGKTNPDAFRGHIAFQMQTLIDGLTKFSFATRMKIGSAQGALAQGTNTIKNQIDKATGCEVHSLTDQSVREAVWNMTDGHCAYCGAALTKYKQENSSQNFCIEHVVPRSSGGPDNIANYVPSCMGCNSSKSSGHVLDFIKANIKRRIYLAAVSKPEADVA